MAKEILMLLGIILIIAGIWTLFPAFMIVPVWYSIIEIIIGLIAVGVSLGEKKPA
ncbi:MAG: hypothetical protein PHG23_01110 [Candidatus Pacebacteria bacterium]|nr:hypothetical protein [Candidatus Paceibacterota bacterium]